ncbi:MAG: hypothetical protein LBK99_01615 [Opitutaceae bacterium]|nr:hypothetical protein [Opitutaceae bacterium]
MTGCDTKSVKKDNNGTCTPPINNAMITDPDSTCFAWAPPVSPLVGELMEMQAEFESSALVVELFPAPCQRHMMHMVRVPVMRNAPWYRGLCERHVSSRIRNRRKTDTRIRRAHISRVMEKLVRGKDGGVYASYILSVAKGRLRKKT